MIDDPLSDLRFYPRVRDRDTCTLLNVGDFVISSYIGAPAHYPIERAFVKK